MACTYPVLIDLKDQKILIIGGGNTAFQKTTKLLKTHCYLTIISPSISIQFQSILPKINYLSKKATLKDIKKDYKLIFACTNDVVFNEKVAQYAKKQNLLINNSSQKKNSNFHNAITIEQTPLLISIYSSGFPFFSKYLKKIIENQFFPKYALLAKFLYPYGERLKNNSYQKVDFFLKKISKTKIKRLLLKYQKYKQKSILKKCIKITEKTLKKCIQ